MIAYNFEEHSKRLFSQPIVLISHCCDGEFAAPLSALEQQNLQVLLEGRTSFDSYSAIPLRVLASMCI